MTEQTYSAGINGYQTSFTQGFGQDTPVQAQAQSTESKFLKHLNRNKHVNETARLYEPHYENAWAKESEADGKQHERIVDSLAGRVAVRSITRGVMGAMFMAGANIVEREYDPTIMKLLKENNSLEEIEAKFSKSWQKAEEDAFNKYKNLDCVTKFLHEHVMYKIAYLFDATFGKGIKTAGNLLNGKGEELTTFHPTAFFGPFNAAAKINPGYTLGEEIVRATWGYAAGSIGDAWGRNLAGICDPNVKKSWIHDGKVNFAELGKATLKATWNILSYRQGEDWAVALPYVYLMRGMRSASAKTWGMSDKIPYTNGHAGIGDNFVVDNGEVIGNKFSHGLWDLQTRFTVYNILTLAYRDTYNHFATSFHNWGEHGYKPGDLLDLPHTSISETIKYAAKTAIKGTLYMTPAIPLFSFPRTAQAATTASFIDKDLTTRVEKPSGFKAYDAKNYQDFSKILRPIGMICEKVEKTAEGAFSFLGFKQPAEWGRQWARSAIGYTPYMIAKYEGEQLVNTPQMDASLYRTLDGIGALNWSEAKAGAYDTWNSLWHKPISEITYSHICDDRGLINSAQHAKDSADIRDNKLHPDDSHVAKVMEHREIKKEIRKIEKEAKDFKKAPQPIDIAAKFKTSPIPANYETYEKPESIISLNAHSRQNIIQNNGIDKTNITQAASF